ncbi:cupin domain-containing protein [Segetibacter sp. 3557_3]|uniref:cupin domain-containing protein n=1 Tax=Segetibacter sp. 3557_3 TaxID=2547429 RepID=UPI001058D66A|nr:cupin domain-containing protein [Segetibacter sp. 3557_3]TDH21319.1 cupin domain-containing protein [Segetibacter sp. 3557_3]
MAYKNKVIENPKTGQKIRFIQTGADTGGELLEMESILRPFSTEPKPHYHPAQREDFLVISGELHVKLNGELKVLHAGDTIHIAENVVHSMWNNSNSQTIVNWKVQPALQTEYLLETTIGLARDGKTNHEGMPNILQTALLLKKYSNEFRLAKPAFSVQIILFSILKPVALIMGLKSVYAKYLD